MSNRFENFEVIWAKDYAKGSKHVDKLIEAVIVDKNGYPYLVSVEVKDGKVGVRVSAFDEIEVGGKTYVIRNPSVEFVLTREEWEFLETEFLEKLEEKM